MSTRVLMIGDFHVPKRAEEIPEEFVSEIKEADLILCTGDLSEDRVLEKMIRVSDTRVVKGEEDHLDIPEQDIVNVEDLKFGMIHGHQLETEDEERQKETVQGEEGRGEEEEQGKLEKLVEFAKLMDVDVLVTGHTHKPFRTEKEGVILFNPGSATGVSKDGESRKTCIRLEAEERDITESEIVTA